MVRLVEVDRHAGGVARLGGAPVGADDQSRCRQPRLSARREADAGGGAVDDVGHFHAAVRLGSGARGFVEQRLAMLGMADAQGPRYVLGEHVQRMARGLGGLRRARLVIGDVVGQVVPASAHEQVVEAQPLHLHHAPG